MNEPKIVIQGLRQGDDFVVGVHVNCKGSEFYLMLKSFIESIVRNKSPYKLLLYKAMIDETIDKALGMDEREKGC